MGILDKYSLSRVLKSSVYVVGRSDIYRELNTLNIVVSKFSNLYSVGTITKFPLKYVKYKFDKTKHIVFTKIVSNIKAIF